MTGLSRTLLACTLALGGPAGAGPAHAMLRLDGYQGPDGAITVQRGGDAVDPYFATLALLLAHRAGLDERPAALHWIAWLLARQAEDGLFARYRGQPGGPWTCAGPADADDALLALWMALLQSEAGTRRPWPIEWRGSLARSRSALEALKDPASGVYRVAGSDPSALLMDNVEVQAALRLMAHAAWQRGEGREARRLARQAESLRFAMARAFPVGPDGLLRYRLPFESEGPGHFYPDRVAHVYPWLYGMSMSGWPGHLSYGSWMKAYRDEWLGLADDPFPWGLVALVAISQGDREAAQRWCDRAGSLRMGPHWNVLEEVVWQWLAGLSAMGGSCSTD